MCLRGSGLGALHWYGCLIKSLPRHGYNASGRRVRYPESVFAHAHGAVRIALWLPEQFLSARGVDSKRLAKMLSAHDDPEFYRGDINVHIIKDPEDRATLKRYKQYVELVALAEMRANIRGAGDDPEQEGMAEEIWELGIEYMEHQTPTACLAHEIDKLELMLTVMYYVWCRTHHRRRVQLDPLEFWPAVQMAVTSPPLVKILQEWVAPFLPAP